MKTENCVYAIEYRYEVASCVNNTTPATINFSPTVYNLTVRSAVTNITIGSGAVVFSITVTMFFFFGIMRRPIGNSLV
jgi:hypothetical protein